MHESQCFSDYDGRGDFARPVLRQMQDIAMSVHSDVMNGHLSWHYLPVAGRIIKDINGVTRRNLWNMDFEL